MYIADGHDRRRSARAPAGWRADRVDRRARAASSRPGWSTWRRGCASPGFEYKATLESEMAAAVAGGVTSLVCPPDTDPPLDEPGLVEMLKHRARVAQPGARLSARRADASGLQGETLTEMAELAEAGCVAFSQADVPLADTQVLLRALQYAATFGYRVWLRPQDPHLARGGVAHDGEVATRLGPAGDSRRRRDDRAATIFELVARHRRARAPVPAVERRRRGAGARREGAKACRSPATSASITCT